MAIRRRHGQYQVGQSLSDSFQFSVRVSAGYGCRASRGEPPVCDVSAFTTN